ncbi:MAG: mannose-1-phosphate guanylyltransferase [Anaerolineae bacterium]|nr:mannose-1-phosphate guanylyltransferase [Anaerolineae bacterium]
MHDNLYAVIMAGGGGTRLWPMSRRDHPKQSLQLFGDRTMFQYAVDRLLPLLPMDRIFVVTAEEQVNLLSQQYPELPAGNFIIEPQGRGTASCIALSAIHIQHMHPDAVMITVTADHFVEDVDNFCHVLGAAKVIAEKGYLVTLGVKPYFAATGYGYIQQGEILGTAAGEDFFKVVKFTEKPDLDLAREFLRVGTYLWNSGMFIWRVDTILNEVRRNMPELYAVAEQLEKVLDDDSYMAKLQLLWPGLQKQTIDYGIMEKASQVAVLAVNFGWSDIGIWDSVKHMHKADSCDRVLMGDIYDQNSQDILVHSTSQRFIATIGLENLVIIDTPDALLIVRRDQSQNVKDVVDYLRLHHRDELL